MWSLVVFILFQCLFLSQATISKSDKKKSSTPKKTQTLKTIDQRKLLDPELTRISILEESDIYCKKLDCLEKHFPYNSLGYITPWNSEGYENAKIFHKKFTHFSPVWYTIHPGCIINGNGNSEWAFEIKKLSPLIKIVPRFIFEGWSHGDMAKLFDGESEEKIQECISFIQQKLTIYNDKKEKLLLDGIVLDNWMNNVTSHMKKDMVHFIHHLYTTLHIKEQLLILVIPPPFYHESMKTAFGKEDFEAVSRFADGFSMNTYDYSFNMHSVGPNAPSNWLQKCIEALTDGNRDLRQKIFMGINFYGYDYSVSEISKNNASQLNPNIELVRPVRSSEFIKVIKDYSEAKCNWIDEWQEHLCQYQVENDQRAIFYPSLYSTKIRLDLAQKLGVNIAIWELGQGLNYFYDIL